MRRRTLLRAAALSPALAVPRIGRAAADTTLHFIPVIDLAFTDPIFAASAQVSRTHGLMVFDMLYGMNTRLDVSPQMLEGHRIEDDGRRWELVLREGLLWHDGEKVLARDCVASIRRWARRDGFGDALMQATDSLEAADDRTIRFRLKRPFPLLPYALGKVAVPACFMMPERLAQTDPFKQIPEVIGSGPFRYKADERLAGVRNAYQRFEAYRPREGGVTDWTSGPKIVHFDRVEWTTMPDIGTATASLQAGEQDWLENAPHDLLPVLSRQPDIAIKVLDPLGFMGSLQVNHLQPPFDKPAVRRALLGAIDQAAFMTAVAGRDPAYQHTPTGYFCPGTPMASDEGLAVFTGPRDDDKVRQELERAGYAGETIVLLVPADSVAQKPLGDVAADMFRQAGMKVDYVALSFGNVLTRRTSKAPAASGGWNAFVGNPQGMDWLNPVGELQLQGNASYPGWATSERIPALRAQWLQAATLDEQQRLCREIQRVAFEEVPFFPLGQYKQPTAYRKRITGVLDGTATFWNVRPA
ncbi:MAG: ABC transporter substrate-binding protein [Acidisphaera sp.]|nr:ABC transporter substrate-binding protein [Acidisphaera sp.]